MICVYMKSSTMRVVKSFYNNSVPSMKYTDICSALELKLRTISFMFVIIVWKEEVCSGDVCIGI